MALLPGISLLSSTQLATSATPHLSLGNPSSPALTCKPLQFSKAAASTSQERGSPRRFRREWHASNARQPTRASAGGRPASDARSAQRAKALGPIEATAEPRRPERPVRGEERKALAPMEVTEGPTVKADTSSCSLHMLAYWPAEPSCSTDSPRHQSVDIWGGGC
jgi:hypothetical protein